METTQQKFWRDVKVPVGAEYIGSVAIGDALPIDGRDVYLFSGSTVLIAWSAREPLAVYGIDEVLTAPIRDSYLAKIAVVIKAHRARTPAPSAPAAMSITREQLEDAAQRSHVHPDHAVKLLGEFGVTVAPPPPPQKSANQCEAEKIAADSVYVSKGHAAAEGEYGFSSSSKSYTFFVMSKNYHGEKQTVEDFKRILSEIIAAALDARDEEHRQRYLRAMAEKDHEMRVELEAYQKAIMEAAERWQRTTDALSSTSLLAALRDVSLTKAERSAAK